MASTYSTSLRLELMATGDQSGTWGDTTNTNLGTLLEQAITGVLSVAQGDATLTLTSTDGASDQARNAVVNLTGAMTGAQNVIVPDANKLYLIKNSTTGGFAVTVKTSAGTGVTVPAGTARWVYADGTNVVDGMSGPWSPSSNDAQALGISGTAWSDLFLASGGVINWVAGDVTITHSANSLAFAGASTGYTFDAQVSTTGNLTAATFSGGPLSSFRNKLINGDFQIWQRATSQTSIGYGSDDRWNNLNTGSTKTASRETFTLGQTDVPGNPTYFSRTVVTSVAAAGNFVIKFQPIESVLTLAGKTATLTFWAKADASKNIAVSIRQNFGTGGSPSAAVDTTGGLRALTTAWQKFSFTVAIPSISGKTLGSDTNDSLNVEFWFDAGSDFNTRASSLGQQSGTFDIAHVSIVEGDATGESDPFSPRQIQQELALCKRYFQKSYNLGVVPGTAFQAGSGPTIFGWGSNAASAANSVDYEVELRAVPTLVIYDSAGTAAKIDALVIGTGWVPNVSSALSMQGMKGFAIYDGGSAAGLSFAYTADAEL